MSKANGIIIAHYGKLYGKGGLFALAPPPQSPQELLKMIRRSSDQGIILLEKGSCRNDGGNHWNAKSIRIDHSWNGGFFHSFGEI